MAKNYRSILLIPLAVLITTVSCGLIDLPDAPFELMLDVSDMPEGWLRVRQETTLLVELDDAESRTRSFSPAGEMDSLINVSQQVSMFTNKTLADEAYDYLLSKSFPTDKWIKPVEINPVLVFTEDKFQVKCLDVSVNSQPISMCRYVQQHQNRVTLIWANIDGEEITLEQLNALLVIVDSRLSQEIIQTPTP